MKTPDLRPLAEPLRDGSVVLYRRLAGWVTAPTADDQRAPLKRIGALAAAGYLVVASDYTSYALYAGTAGWILGAYMLHGTVDEPEPEPEPEPELDEETADEPEGPGLDYDEFLDALRASIGAGSGVHLAALPGLLEKHTGQPWTADRARAALDAAGVPVERGVRMPGANPSTGVRLTSLPKPLPAPAVDPVVDVVVPGQDAATGTATATATPPELRAVGDVAMELRDDPDNPVRTRVRVITKH